MDEPDVVLVGTWKTCPVCGCSRCTSCEGQQNFAPHYPPEPLVMGPRGPTLLADGLLHILQHGGQIGTEFYLGGCRVEVDKDGPFYLVDRRDPRMFVMDYKVKRWPWRKVLQEALRRA